MCETLKEVELQIQRQEKILQELRYKKKRIEAQKLTPEQELAVELHKKFCRHNHTDACGWYYEIQKDVHNWNSGQYSAHQTWLDKAKAVLNSGIEKEVAIKLMELV